MGIDLRESEGALKQLVARILDEAKTVGASSAEVSVSQDHGLSVSVRKGEVENIEFNQDRGFGITLYIGDRKGVASTSDSNDASIKETVARAANIARYTEPDKCNGLADADRMPQSMPDLDLYHPWPITPDDAAELAKRCEAAGLGFDKRISNTEGAQTSTQAACRVYGNSHGFVGSYISTRHGLSCLLIAEDAKGMQRDYWYTVDRLPGRLQAAEEVGLEAARRTIARLSPRKVPTGRFPVVFSPQMATGLIGHLLGAISGGALYRKASFLLDSLGSNVASSHLSLSEQPHLVQAIGSASFDGDGVATTDKAFIEQGIVKNYLLSTYSARKLGMSSTGNAGGVHNLIVSGKVCKTQDLLGLAGTGLYVTELMGQGVNGVTGDYSRGASGFWIESGELSFPVDEITIAGNLKDIYRDIVCIGDDPDLRSNIRAPSILIGSMTLAGS
ncbi:MAG: metalloprotease PmbA [Proteobacteria bacterium]|nr:metalloprotease PmbA [Pseudomonadota bacterium]